jgi:RNA polymerase sigma-70 factor (ECF subfamily)
VTSPALTRTNEELLDASRNGDEGALAVLVERMVRLRMDRRLQGRVGPADVAQEAYRTARGRFLPYTRGRPPLLPAILMRDAGQEVSLHPRALPQVTSLSLAQRLR